MEAVSKKEVVNFFLSKGMLLSADIKDTLSTIRAEELYRLVSEKSEQKDMLIINSDIRNLLLKLPKLDINWFDLEKSKALLEKGKNKAVYKRFIEYLTTPEKQKPVTIEDLPEIKKDSSVKVISNYGKNAKKRGVQDFVQHFNARYKSMELLLKNRQELKSLMSISRVMSKKDRGTVSIIGLVSKKDTTKNNNIILTLEDSTGLIKVLVNKNRPDLLEEAKNIVNDEVLAIMGTNAEKIIFANKILWPDVPATREFKKSPDEAYAVFLSDIHVGSNNFLKEEFEKFIRWLNLGLGDEKQKSIASKVKYVFIIGDVVDGVGIYPGQEDELEIQDISSQYSHAKELLKKIPQRINLIICPGNHDAVRLAEPQPAFDEEYAKPLTELPNATFVSNPSLVRIHSSEKFSGFDVLLYHGYSFDYYVANVDSIRNGGGYNRADLIMKFLLKRRHLAPTHTSTLYVPDTKSDALMVNSVPDIFATGHIHKSIAAHYRNITLISGSCWQKKTSFQERVGHNPEPSRVPILNLQTREIKILRFGK